MKFHFVTEGEAINSGWAAPPCIRWPEIADFDYYRDHASQCNVVGFVTPDGGRFETKIPLLLSRPEQGEEFSRRARAWMTERYGPEMSDEE